MTYLHSSINTHKSIGRYSKSPERNKIVMQSCSRKGIKWLDCKTIRPQNRKTKNRLNQRRIVFPSGLEPELFW